MKYIISESQNNFLYLIRRLNDLEMVHHMGEIINEGLDMFDVCNYSFEDYLDTILKGSVNTLIYSYEENSAFGLLANTPMSRCVFLDFAV